MVKVGGPGRKTCFLFRAGFCTSWSAFVSRRLRIDFLCANVRDLRSVARIEATISGEGGSPKMKNLMKAASKSTTDSCPRMRPCVKDRLLDAVVRQSVGYESWAQRVGVLGDLELT